jgi:ribosomal protein S18 acetylase RimI-like enzyme
MSEENKVFVAKTEDAPQILHVLQQTWLDTYINKEKGITEDVIRQKSFFVNPEKYLNQIIKKIETYLVIRDDKEKVIGFASPRVMNNKARVGKLYILKEAQGKGHGKKLLNAAIEYWSGQDVYLQVVTYNQKAIDFYLKNGFEFVEPKVTKKFTVAGAVTFDCYAMVHRANQTSE